MLMDAVRSAVANSICRSVAARQSWPSMPSVPLISARPSFSPSSTGVRPAAARASAAGRVDPSGPWTTPSPISTMATWASGARSPEQPSEPYSGTTGVMPRSSRAASSSAVASRMPVRPVANVDSRSSISARTTSVSTGSPEPAACERISERCRSARLDGGMDVLASAPKPVEMP